jgi:NAD(P)-dependent dehydrogenase (short-subunit alcohol dehydrogenase family)
LGSDARLDLTGRRALVTGAGQGLGAAIAVALARSGAEVVVNDLNPARADETAAKVRAAGGEAVAIAFDVTDWAAVRDGFAGAPAVDILVNNAGNAGMDGWPGLVPLAESDPADWEPFLRVNLYGVMHCTRAALPAMIETGSGRVVTILSDAARTGEPLMAAYSAAKAGAAGFSRSVAREVGRHGITVNCVALGTMRAGPDAPLNEVQERAMRRYPVRRAGLPDDVTTLVTLLAGDAGEWITGQTIPVNGGLSFAL